MIIIDEDDDRFFLSESTIPDAGYGVFAARDITEDEIINNKGILVKPGSMADQCTHYANAYKFLLKKGNDRYHVVPVGFGGMVNHCPERQNVALCHTEDEIMMGGSEYTYSFYRPLRLIHAGEEILGDYGYDPTIKNHPPIKDPWSGEYIGG